MKLSMSFGLLLALMLTLTACLDTTKTTLTPPSDEADYGISYPTNGRTTQVRLDSIDELQAFAQAFEYHHRHQPIFHFWHEDAMKLRAGDNLILPGTCKGNLKQTSEMNEAQTMSTHSLVFDSYCNPTLLWNTHSEEFGRQVYTGSNDLFLVEYFNYQKHMSAFYRLSVGGSLRVSIGKDKTTYNYEDVVVKQGAPLIEYRFVDFKITFVEGGAIYNGKIYHPFWGWAEISTGEDLTSDRIETAEDENQRLNRPIAGRIQIKGALGTGVLTFNNDQTYNLELDLGGNPAQNPAPLTNRNW
jgi:hypothetical protein